MVPPKLLPQLCWVLPMAPIAKLGDGEVRMRFVPFTAALIILGLETCKTFQTIHYCDASKPFSVCRWFWTPMVTFLKRGTTWWKFETFCRIAGRTRPTRMCSPFSIQSSRLLWFSSSEILLRKESNSEAFRHYVIASLELFLFSLVAQAFPTQYASLYYSYY